MLGRGDERPLKVGGEYILWVQARGSIRKSSNYFAWSSPQSFAFSGTITHPASVRLFSLQGALVAIASCHRVIVSLCLRVIVSSHHRVIVSSYISSCQLVDLWQCLPTVESYWQFLTIFCNIGLFWQLLIPVGNIWQYLTTSGNFVIFDNF